MSKRFLRNNPHVGMITKLNWFRVNVRTKGTEGVLRVFPFNRMSELIMRSGCSSLAKRSSYLNGRDFR